jgi:uncharacterized membrane protein YqjE
MTATPPEPTRERSLGELVTSLSGELSTLFRQEVALAKAELRGEAAKAGQAAGMLGAAAVFGLVALLILVTAAALGLAAILDNDWLAFLIVGVVLLIVAAVLALSGRKRFQAVGPPQQTIDTLREDAQTIKERRP